MLVTGETRPSCLLGPMDSEQPAWQKLDVSRVRNVSFYGSQSEGI